MVISSRTEKKGGRQAGDKKSDVVAWLWRNELVCGCRRVFRDQMKLRRGGAFGKIYTKHGGA
jgi:hypothetical protein